MIVIDSISCFSARMSAIINSSILHTSFRMVCWPPYCPLYYTCEYYNAYVEICLYWEIPLYLLTRIGSERRRPARRRVGSGASPAPELPLWSKLIPACPIPLGRLKLIRLKDALHIEKSPQSVDTERGNEYNTYRVRPKRSATNKVLFPKRELPLWLQQGGYFFLTVIVTDFISRFSATKRMIINSIILHTSFRMVCWPPLALFDYTWKNCNIFAELCRQLRYFLL